MRTDEQQCLSKKIVLFLIFCFLLYLLAAFVFYWWPALLIFGLRVFWQPGSVTAGVLNFRDCRVFESNNYLLLL